MKPEQEEKIISFGVSLSILCPKVYIMKLMTTGIYLYPIAKFMLVLEDMKHMGLGHWQNMEAIYNNKPSLN